MDGWEHNLDCPETGEHLGASYGSLFHTDVLLLGFEKKNPRKVQYTTLKYFISSKDYENV